MSSARRTVRLAAVVSLVAALIALALAALTTVPDSAIVVSVIVVGFALSWLQSGRELQQAEDSHRQPVHLTIHRHSPQRAA